MRLPNAQRARVDREKIADYLLAASHPHGQSKAEFFFKFGFRIAQWQNLADALRIHGASHQVIRIIETNYGTKYIIDGLLETPDGRNPYVRTIWQIDKESDYPRFVTAYPAG